jgi:multicomponent K+:H+ antiporter subunit G
VLVVGGALAALVGAIGLVRLRSFFQRVHAPTLGATAGTWALAMATALQFSFLREQVFVHALLIPFFLVVTTPITTVFLMRAGLFRSRQAQKDVPPSVTQPSAPPEP